MDWMGLVESSRQEYWSQCHFFSPLIQGLNPFPTWAGRFFTTVLPRKPSNLCTQLSKSLSNRREKGFMVCSWSKDKWDNITVIVKDHLRPPCLVSNAQQSDSVFYVVEDRETWHAAVHVFTVRHNLATEWQYTCICVYTHTHIHGTSQVTLVVINLLANAEGIRDKGSIPGSGRSAGGGHGNPIQYSCLENSMDRGAWLATVPWGHKELDMT